MQMMPMSLLISLSGECISGLMECVEFQIRVLIVTNVANVDFNPESSP